MSRCSRSVAVVWRWLVGAQLWMVAIAWWDGNHLPGAVVSKGAGPLEALSQLTAALSWHGLIAIAGGLAEYGLLVCVPLWVVSELFAWKESAAENSDRELKSEIRAISAERGDQGDQGDRSSELSRPKRLFG